MPLASIYSSTAARTPTISADVAGFPDLILVRPPRLVVAELKSVRGPVTARQQLWLDDVAAVPGIEVHVWRPDDWARYDSMVTRTLRISVGYYEAAKTAHDAIASRVISMVHRVGYHPRVMLVGGVARNVGIVDSLERGLAMGTIDIPENPEFVGALCAALAATRDPQ